ncbi:MAG: hypothetical protein GIW97_08175 [Candidatus Eremiobacteraeota bacterium]|nr:hypothetical protein [Candidatus Eremiobacteraeota bacterium]
MSSRRLFLRTTLASGASLLLATKAQAQTSPAAAPASTPTPASKPPSAVALAQANDMRRYDPKLTDADIANIAGQIDGNLKSGARLNPRGKRLKNSDEPVTTIHPCR